MLAALDRFEGFIAERDRLPDLVQCAMAHAQFQSIHPFVGGNGRLGRVLIVLFLVARGRLSQPLLYLSAYLEAHRREYYTLLQRVRTHGDWLPWLVFFARGRARDGRSRLPQARTLLGQRDHYLSRCPEKRCELVDELFVSPFLTAREVRRVLWVSGGTARRTLAGLEDLGLLARVEGTDRPRVYVAQSILDAIVEPIEAMVGRRRRRGAGGRAPEVVARHGHEAEPRRRPPHARGHGDRRRGSADRGGGADRRRPGHPAPLHRPGVPGARVLRHRPRRVLRSERGAARGLRRPGLCREPLRAPGDRGPAAPVRPQGGGPGRAAPEAGRGRADDRRRAGARRTGGAGRVGGPGPAARRPRRRLPGRDADGPRHRHARPAWRSTRTRSRRSTR